MSHKTIFDWFKLYFPNYDKHTVTWFPNGKNSIRVRWDNGRDFIFTFNGEKDWCFQTVENFLKKMKGE